MVEINNLTSLDFKILKIKEILDYVLDFFYLNEFDISISVISDSQIQKANLYRNKNNVTDVLSFPYIFESNMWKKVNLEALNIDLIKGIIKEYKYKKEDIFLGEILICSSVCLKQAKEFNVSVSYEILYLLIHSFLHLLGFLDESTELDYKKMKKIQDELLLLIKNKFDLLNF
ncbi:rRNA maturation RNase YbeY [Patescibacteria group bacterium]|nr:rRNA maturation RNase YbeY [Patescibacteria group bacterium]